MSESMHDGTIAPIAKTQLEPYVVLATRWPLVWTAGYYRCRVCTQAIWRELDDNGHSYMWNESEITALVVAHIRQRHPEAIDGNE
jgi:hypothetical protein